MYRVIIWGIGVDYDNLLTSIRYYEMLSHIKVIGVTSQASIYKSVDGYAFICKEKLKKYDFDILVIASEQHFFEIRDEAILLGISEDMIIRGSIFLLPNLDMAKYLNIKNSRISIFSNNCLGGLIYHRLCMDFLSPFINMFVPGKDYIKFLKNPKKYINEPLILKEMVYNKAEKRKWPICYCGDILLGFNHYDNFEQANYKWCERKFRINWNNLFVMMYTKNKEIAEEFITLPYKKKICFVPFETENEYLFSIKYCDINEVSKLPFWRIVNGNATGNYKYYDILELLSCNKKKRIELS